MILGVDVLIYVTDGLTEKLLGGQRNATLEVSKETVEVTSKQEQMSWIKEYAGTYATWSVSCDGVIWDSEEAYSMFIDKILNGDAKFTLKMKTDKYYLKGVAIASKFSLEAPYDDAATYSVSFTGSGPLTKTPINQ